jgi:bifunctional non-homologous end joining protein LigD
MASQRPAPTATVASQTISLTSSWTRILRPPPYIRIMPWKSSTRVLPASGFIEPCLPSVATRPPIGNDWVFELKHDGYRLMVRKHEDRVRIYTRRGADWTVRFPRIVSAIRKVKATSLLIDGEGVVYDKDDTPSFALLHSREYDKEVSLIAFDLLELEGAAVRRDPLLKRKSALERLLTKVKDGIEINAHLEGDGAAIFKQVCKLGHEGVVAKRKDLPYESGRSRRWLKIKNPESAAARRAEDGSI